MRSKPVIIGKRIACKINSQLRSSVAMPVSIVHIVYSNAGAFLLGEKRSGAKLENTLLRPLLFKSRLMKCTICTIW